MAFVQVNLTLNWLFINRTQVNTLNTEIKTETDGRFTYDYKYGRTAGKAQQYIKVVPFSTKNIPIDVIDRLRLQIPNTFNLIKNFSINTKAAFMADNEAIVK